MSELWPEVELFEWEGVLSIREKVSRKTILTIYRTHCQKCGNNLDSREYWFRERMQKVVGPKLVELMNLSIDMSISNLQAIRTGVAMAQVDKQFFDDAAKTHAPPPDTLPANGNGHLNGLKPTIKLGKTDQAKYDALKKKYEKLVDKLNQKYSEEG